MPSKLKFTIIGCTLDEKLILLINMKDKLEIILNIFMTYIKLIVALENSDKLSIEEKLELLRLYQSDLSKWGLNLIDLRETASPSSIYFDNIKRLLGIYFSLIKLIQDKLIKYREEFEELT